MQTYSSHGYQRDLSQQQRHPPDEDHSMHMNDPRTGHPAAQERPEIAGPESTNDHRDQDQRDGEIEPSRLRWVRTTRRLDGSPSTTAAPAAADILVILILLTCKASGRGGCRMVRTTAYGRWIIRLPHVHRPRSRTAGLADHFQRNVRHAPATITHMVGIFVNETAIKVATATALVGASKTASGNKDRRSRAQARHLPRSSLRARTASGSTDSSVGAPVAIGTTKIAGAVIANQPITAPGHPAAA